MTDTSWLEAAGLVPVGEGVWRDEETGLYILLVAKRFSVFRKLRGTTPCGFFGCHMRINQVGRAVVEFSGTRDPLQPDDFAAAVQLAARIARAYNERGQ